MCILPLTLPCSAQPHEIIVFVCGFLIYKCTNIRTYTRLYKTPNILVCGIVFINLYQQ